MSITPVLTFAAHKGGVGRTLITHQLAGTIAQRFRVLVIDQDSQASISKNVFGKATVEGFQPSQTVAAVYRDAPFDPLHIIRETNIENMFIVPTRTEHMKSFDVPIASPLGLLPTDYQFRLKHFVDGVRDRFDMILIDTPPNIHNLPGISALNATDFVLTVFEPDKNAVESIADVKTLVAHVLQTTNPNLMDLGCVLTNATRKENIDKTAELTVRKLYGLQVFQTVLWRRTVFKQDKYKLAPQAQVAPRSEEAKMFLRLLREILQRIKDQATSVGDTKTAHE